MKYYYLIIFFFIAGCFSENLNDKTAFGGKKYGNNFTYFAPERTMVFFPLASVTLNDQRILSQIFEPLFSTNDQGVSENNLAKKYEELSEGKIIQITIKSNIFFHSDDCFSSGENRLTSQDVEFSLDFACSGSPFNSLGQILRDKIVGGQEFYNSSKHAFNKNGVAGIKVVNDTVIQIHLKKKYAGFQKILAHPSITIFSRKAYDFYKQNFVHHPIGTGPFQFLSTDENKTVLMRNPIYWKKDEYGNQLPFLKGITIRYTNNLNEEYLSFSKKKSDIIFELPTDKLDNAFGSLSDAQKGKNLLHRVVLKKGVKVNYLSFDCSTYPFNDIRVRKAFNLAIDRKSICLDVLNGEGNYMLKGFIPRSSFYNPTYKSEMILYNPKQAQKLMLEAGFNKEHPFPELTFYINAQRNSRADKWANSVVKQLKSTLGVNLQIKHTSLSEKFKLIKQKKAKIWKSTWLPDYPDADAYLSQFYGNVKQIANKESLYNSFNSPIFDSLYRKSQLVHNLEQRNEIQRKCDKFLIDQAAIAPIFSEDLFLIVNLRVRDFSINSSGIIDFSKIYIKEVY
jgi:oligopeptide transport system substrate-binding protein